MVSPRPALGSAAVSTTILAIEHGKHDLADIGARCYERALAQRFRQVVQEPMHDAEDFFGGALIVRDLNAERAFARNGVDEEARGDVGRNAELACL